MSFAGDVKTEILNARPRARRLIEAQAYGLFAFARAFSPDEVALRTESPEIARLYRHYLLKFTRRDAKTVFEQRSVRGKTLYDVRLEPEHNRRALLTRMAGAGGAPLSSRFEAQEEAAAFLGGVFLACGNATDPEKSYHLEFAAREQPLAEELLELLSVLGIGAGITRRRGGYPVYCKECAQIEDLLTLMGASKASLAMIEVEIVKDVRNKAMRQTNCETANIDKTVKASAGQIADIQLVLSRIGLESLPEQLRETAVIRLENPELSLRELAGAFAEPVSRSGVFHRLDKLSKIAERLRAAGGEGKP